MDHAHALTILLLLSAHSVSGRCTFTEEASQEDCVALYECSETTDKLSTYFRNWDCFQRRMQIVCDPGIACPLGLKHHRLKIKIENPSVTFMHYSYKDIGEFSDNIFSMTLTNGDMNVIPDELFSLPKLTVLDVSHNKINSIDLKLSLKLEELQVFNVSYNLISILETAPYDDYGYGSNVTAIDLSFNAIEKIPDNYFNKFTNLLHLNMSYNLINNFNILTFEGLSQLETLFLSNNHLHKLDMTLARFTNLKMLILDHNDLFSIDENNFKMLSSLTKLDLSFNKIISIDELGFQNMISLRSLLVNNNNIVVITKSMFINNNMLQEVNFENNEIHTIEPFSFKGTNITLCNFRKNALTSVNDKSIFEGINVKELDFSDNNITSLGEKVFIELQSKLRKLNLSSNSISNIHESSFKALNLLSELDLSNNKLKQIVFDTSDLTSLSYFNVENNLISKLSKDTFRQLKSLKKINFSNNAIVEIDLFSFQNIGAVEDLDLSNNDLPNVIVPYMFQGLTKTYKLHLSHSKITSLLNSAFYTMMNLIHINASYGAINTLEYNVFNGTENIWSLDLSHNRIETFIVNNSYLKHVQEIYLNDNQIRNITNQNFYGLNHLRILNLENNNILQISIDAFHSLYEISLLYLSSNVNMMLDTSVFSNISTLIEIRLHNVWKPYNFKNANKVFVLNLDLSSSNISNVSSVMVYKLEKLETLLLNSNKIRFIDRNSFNKMSSLTSLDLSNNLISTIKPGSFSGTRSLTLLDLHNNNLVSITFGVFNALDNLQVLNLSGNAVNVFQSSALHDNQKLRILSLENNLIDNFDFEELKTLAIAKVTIGGNLIPCHDLALITKNNKYDMKITAEVLNFHVENVDGVSCKGARIETSTDYKSIDDVKAETAKMADVMKINDVAHLTYLISDQLDALKSALYFEAACMFIIVCLLFGSIFFVYIKLRSNLVRSHSLRSKRPLAASTIEMEL